MTDFAEDWRAFVATRQRGWNECPFRADLTAAVGGYEDIASVVYAYLDADWARWLAEPSDLLEGETPQQCLASDRGRRQLMELLMRMH